MNPALPTPISSSQSFGFDSLRHHRSFAGVDATHINPWMMLPFGALLGAIALGPLLFAKWWGRHFAKVAFGLAAITLVYYFAGLKEPRRVLEIGHEYFSFIALIGSLFVVSGGIHINVKGEAKPMVNVVFLLVGALVANVLGTTGASMLLIRPWIRMNRYRITAYHVVFFIFIVSNVGGCLTPIGDPPLFLGYIYGIPFWWVAEHCVPMWAMGMGILLAMFYVVDRLNFNRAPRGVRERETAHEEWRFDGLGNILFLAIILTAVFVNRPPFLREALMIGAAAGSYFTTKKSVHESNHFNFHPIKEVAILFVGVFATMMPALDWLAANAREMLGPGPAVGVFYWGTGSLSSVLDNAPTYLSFLSATFGSFVNHDIVAQVQAHIASGAIDFSHLTGPYAEQVRQTLEALQKYHSDHVLAKRVTKEEIEVCFLLGNATFSKYIVAISIGAVFFGACTYIGNGPNFMVKAIAEHAKVRSPTFVEYIWKYTLPFMVPVLVVVWLTFFFH
jgi:Na+/H+ antiporter NhaD/arsenite permease-like protein